MNTSIGNEPCFSEQVNTNEPDLKIMEYCGYRMGANGPNPASPYISIRLKQILDKEVKMDVYDISGKKVISEIIPTGTDITEINTHNLQSGTYIGRFLNKDEILQEIKFVIIQKQ